MAMEDQVLLPKGSRLFHGTIEDLKDGLVPGGYDEVLWFADVPAIAQLYIPRSGTTLHTPSSSIARPSDDQTVQLIQRMIDLDYDMDRVTRDDFGKITGFSIPRGWEDVDLNFGFVHEVEDRLADIGYEGEGMRGFQKYAFHIADDRVLAPGDTQQGTLCVATTLRDMVLWRKATGEGDLTQLQYHDVEGFIRAREEGLDGVIIDDFAQSEEWGNLGHLSVGIFQTALPDLEITCVPATYEEWERRFETKAWPQPSPAYFQRLLRESNPLSALKASLMPPR